MYLAMLAGGQIIKQIVKKTLRLSGDEGLQIFNFKGTERKQLREQIKAAVDSLELSRSTKDAIVAEKIRCFHMNNQIVKAVRIEWHNYQKLGLLILIGIVLIILVVALLYWLVVILSDV